MSVMLLFSCSKDLTKSSSTSDKVIFPPPPDTTRVQYLTSISLSTDIEGKQSKFNKFMFGEDIPMPIIKPFGLTVRDSSIYICDPGIGGLVLIDLSKKSFDNFIPSGKGQLRLPLNCSVDENGFLFVADGGRRQIVVFDKDGKYVSEFGEPVESFRPTDVTVFGGKIFLVSIKSQRVFVYDRNNYKLITNFPNMESGDDGYLYQPTNLFVDESFIYVSDIGDNRIKVYSHDGKYVRSIGGSGNYAGQLSRPKGIAVDKKKNLFVVDAAFENVQIFDKQGNILMFFGGPYKGPGNMWLPADVAISYSNLQYFRQFVDPSFNLSYLIFVTNQYGPDKVSVYGFVEPLKK
jgi:DNA-binding beta-propeller fold protein YncE